MHRRRKQCGDGRRELGSGGKREGAGGGDGNICNSVNNENKVKNYTLYFLQIVKDKTN